MDDDTKTCYTYKVLLNVCVRVCVRYLLLNMNEMTRTQHFGDLQVAFAQFLLVGSSFRSEAGVHQAGVHLLTSQPQANEQVENAYYQHGKQEEGQRRNQDDPAVDAGRLNHT